jgi:hypothetical protein
VRSFESFSVGELDGFAVGGRRVEIDENLRLSVSRGDDRYADFDVGRRQNGTRDILALAVVRTAAGAARIREYDRDEQSCGSNPTPPKPIRAGSAVLVLRKHDSTSP